MVLTAKEALVITPSVAFARESTRFACISSANNASMKSWVYLNSSFLLRAAIGFSRRVTSAGGRLLFFQSVFNLSLHIMHLFPFDRPPSILFAKEFRIHDSFIAAPPQKMRGTLGAQPVPGGIEPQPDEPMRPFVESLVVPRHGSVVHKERRFSA